MSRVLDKVGSFHDVHVSVEVVDMELEVVAVEDMEGEVAEEVEVAEDKQVLVVVVTVVEESNKDKRYSISLNLPRVLAHLYRVP